jgi:hypothetical protein
MSALSPETLTLASIVSVKIQSCLTKYEDEVNRRKKWVATVRCAAALLKHGMRVGVLPLF